MIASHLSGCQQPGDGSEDITLRLRSQVPCVDSSRSPHSHLLNMSKEASKHSGGNRGTTVCGSSGIVLERACGKNKKRCRDPLQDQRLSSESMRQSSQQACHVGPFSSW